MRSPRVTAGPQPFAWLRPAGGRLAAGCLALAIALQAGGAMAQGLVQGVFGLVVSPAPGAPAAQVLRGGVALRLEQVEQGGRTWRQLLASDGRHGWTAEPLSAERAVTARAAAGPLELMPVPPGDADFQGASALPVAEGSVAVLRGGSRVSQVAEMSELMRPEWLNPGLGPWPRWDAGSTRGWAPLSAVALSWAGPASAAAAGSAGLREQLGAWGLEGSAREPFLAPLRDRLQQLAPREGASALDLSGPADKASRRTTLHGAWRGPLFAYRAAAAPAGGLGAMLVFAQDAARAFVFVPAGSGAARIAWADDDHLEVVRVEEADLDGDGHPDWLLELVGVYGDGYYSELWVVDGRSGSRPLSIQRQVLSRGPGDQPGAEQEAAWGLNADRSLWIWRSTPRSSRMAQLRYRSGRLTVAGAPAALLVLGSDEQATAAQQRRMQAMPATPQAVALPLRSAAGVRWITALPASDLAQARRWAAERSLPSTSALSLPLAGP